MNYEDYKRALEYVAESLLTTRCYDVEERKVTGMVMDRHNDLEEALRHAIGGGCGFTIRPRIDDFFLANIRSIDRVELWRRGAKAVEVPKRHFLEAAREVWSKRKNRQLTIF